MAASILERIGWGLRRWWLWTFAALVLLFGAYTAAGFLLVPRIAKSRIETYVEQDLKRHVTIAKIAFNPFTFAAEAGGFALTEADGAPLASFDHLAVEFLASSLFAEAWTFKQVILDRPNLRLIVDADGSLNLAKLRRASRDAIPGLYRFNVSSCKRSVQIPALRIGTFAVHDGRVALEDRSRSQPFGTTLTPIEFTLSDFRTAQNFQNEYRFEGTTLAGERLNWSGQFSIRPFGSNGKFAVTGVKSQTIASYLQNALPFVLVSGSVDVEGQYRATLADQIGLQLELPAVKLHDFGIAPRGGANAATWISVPETTLSNVAVALPDRKVTVGRIDVDGAKLTLWREPNGQLNVLQLLPVRPAAASTSTATKATSAALKTSAPAAQAAEPPAAGTRAISLSVGTVQIRAASINAEDRTVRPAVKFALTPMDMTISGWSTETGDALKVNASVTLNGKGRVTAEGDMRLTPLATNLAVELVNIDVTPFKPYIAPLTAVQLQSGAISAKGKLTLNPTPAKGQPGLQYLGNVSLANVATLDPLLRQDLIKWQRLDVTGADFRQGPGSLAIDRIYALKPYGKIVISPNQTLNVATAFAPPVRPARAARSRAPITVRVAAIARPRAAAIRATAASLPMPVRIRQIILENGSTDFADFSIQPNFAAAIGSLGGTVAGISSAPTTRAQIKLTGSVDRFAPVDISGQFNLFAATAFSDIIMNFRNMELTTFNPYSGKYAGYNIAKGKLTTELHYKIENRKLDLQHHIVLDQLEFGDATNSKDAVPLPVRLAVALLKDREGVIDINLPVTGSMDDPEFQVGPIVWKAIVGLLTKIVTAPFDAIASLFGGGPDLSYIDFAPGSAALAAEEAGKIEKLAMALGQRPGLRLDIPLQTVSPADDAALTEAAFNQAIGEVVLPPPSRSLFQRQQTPATPEQQRLALLAQLYQEKLGSPPMYPAAATSDMDLVKANIVFLEMALRPRYAPTEANREQLAKARAAAVQQAILGHDGIMPERIFLTERESGKGSATTARMELSLQ